MTFMNYVLQPIKKLFDKDRYYFHGNILLEDYKIIYFPVAKVACSSMKKIFADLLDLKYDLDDIDDSVHELNFPFVKKKDISRERYDGYLKFAFVRNPWDRLFSCYKSKILQDPDFYIRGFTQGVFDGFLKYGDKFYAGMSFREFVFSIREIPDNDADEHFRSQYVTLYDRNGIRLTNYIGRFENIDKDFSHIANWLHQEVNLPRLMQSDNRLYTEAYTHKLMKIVAERYKEDIELFNYSFFSFSNHE